ncbi:MAG: hypothetical protein K2X39_00050 [Silvanigrellaceae bacterium]|nr:hypothetical protein [Silvanigrellaceae bacterium]
MPSENFGELFPPLAGQEGSLQCGVKPPWSEGVSPLILSAAFSIVSSITKI